MLPVLEQTIAIEHSSDVSAARRIITESAMKIGFDGKARNEISIVVTELATNILTYAGKGMLHFGSFSKDQREGIQIEAIDSGPGFADIDRAMEDGYSTSNSLGYGLGTVNRLMDEVEIDRETKGEYGAHVVARKWIQRHTSVWSRCPYDIGIATRPHPGMKLNGDFYVVKPHGSSILTAVIDGLGHGQFAHRAAQKAAQYIDTHPCETFENLFQGTFRSCRGTRGVVMALLRLDWEHNSATFSSIGNIEVKTWNGKNTVQFPIRRGIIGVNAPKPIVSRVAWDLDFITVLFTDGLTSHWTWNEISNLVSGTSSHMAREMLRIYGKDNDDATVMVIKKRIEQGS